VSAKKGSEGDRRGLRQLNGYSLVLKMAVYVFVFHRILNSFGVGVAASTDASIPLVL